MTDYTNFDDLGIDRSAGNTHYGRIRGGRETQEDAFRIFKLEKSPSNIKALLTESFAKVNSLMLDKNNGTTCSVAHICAKNILTVAYIGDSPVFLYVRNKRTGEGKVISLMMGHNTNNSDELIRLENAGAILRVHHASVYLENDKGQRIAVTRAFGDTSFRNHGLISEPEIFDIDLNIFLQGNYDVYVCAASDGIGQPKQTGDFMEMAIKKRQNIARQVVLNSMDLKADNVTFLCAKVGPQTKNLVMLVGDGHGSTIHAEHVCNLMRTRLTLHDRQSQLTIEEIEKLREFSYKLNDVAKGADRWRRMIRDEISILTR